MKIQRRCSELGAGSNRTQRAPRTAAFCLSPDRQTPWASIPGTGFSRAVPGSVHVSFLFFILNSCVWPPCSPAPTSPSSPHLPQSRVDWQSCDSLSSHLTPRPLPAAAPPSLGTQANPYTPICSFSICLWCRDLPHLIIFHRKGRLSKSKGVLIRDLKTTTTNRKGCLCWSLSGSLPGSLLSRSWGTCTLSIFPRKRRPGKS